MSYVLENHQESERLNLQNSLPQYSIEQELKQLSLTPKNLAKARILDAGCGAGDLTNILLEYGATVDACDFSEIRIQQTKKLKHLSKAQFFIQDLTKPLENNQKYDFIFLRFVLQHGLHPEHILTPLKNSLAPHGAIIIIEIDDGIFGVSTNDSNLKTYISKLVHDLPVDLKIGRKLPRLAHELGFKVDRLDAIPMIFQGQDLENECTIMQQRFVQAKPYIDQSIGAENFDHFVSLYLKELRDSRALITNKVLLRLSNR